MSPHTYTHDIFEESMCVLSTGISGRYARFLHQRPGMLLQQDNARPHVACVTTHYLRQNNVNVMDDWPALSADLNPIEHCWDYLKKIIRKLQLDNVRDLHNVIRREWQGLPQGYIRSQVRSMRRRCDAVFMANGGHTRY